MPSNLPIDGHSFRRVEVLSGTPRRRRWSAAEKAAIVAESRAPGAQTSEIALRYGLHRNQLDDWRREFGTAAVGNAIAEVGKHLRGSTRAVALVVGRGCTCQQMVDSGNQRRDFRLIGRELDAALQAAADGNAL